MACNQVNLLTFTKERGFRNRNVGWLVPDQERLLPFIRGEGFRKKGDSLKALHGSSSGSVPSTRFGKGG